MAMECDLQHVETHLPFVHSVAWKVHRRWGIPLHVHDDLVQAGFVGLLEARNRFRSGGDATFLTFAGPRVEGEMIQYLRRGCRSVFEAVDFEDEPRSNPTEDAVLAREDLCRITEAVEGLGYRRRRVMESVLSLESIDEVAAEVFVPKRKALRWRRQLIGEWGAMLEAA